MKPISPIIVGNTPVHEAKALSKMLGTGHVYLKMESHNPTGSHKDRLAMTNVDRARFENKNGITVGTCGSYGLSIAWACHNAGLPCRIFIPRKYSNSKISEYTSDIFFIEGSYEDAIAESQRFSSANNYFDGNPFAGNAELCYGAYASIAREIMTVYSGKFDVVWLPVGNGTTLTGVYREFKRQNYSPVYGAVSSLNGSAVLSSMNNAAEVVLNKDTLNESEINEPLVSWMPPTNISELIAFSQSCTVLGLQYTDADLIAAAELLNKCEKISSPPYSAAGLAGLIHERSRFDSGTSHLIILTS